MDSMVLHSLDDTENVGKLIGKNLISGTIILLSGELGTGKTTVTKSICAALGVNPDVVISPTYTLVNVYTGKWLIHHVDLFRLSSPEDLDNFDRDDLICEEGITLVEWPELIKPLLAEEPRLMIELDFLEEDTRRMAIRPLYDPFDSLFDALTPYEHARP